MPDFKVWKPPQELLTSGYKITLGRNLYLGSRAAYDGVAKKKTEDGTSSKPVTVYVIFRNREVQETEIKTDHALETHALETSRISIPYEVQNEPLTVEIFRKSVLLRTEDSTCDCFEITSFCGMGGFGEVWDAKWHQAGQQKRVAIKFPHAATPVSAVTGESPLLKQLLEQEQLRGLGRIVIRHHGCLTLDQLKNPGWPKHGLVMDCAKGTLRDYLQLQKLDVNTAAAICRRLITLVSDFHRLGYVHCDLKSDNLLFYPEYDPEHLLIGDVGTATPHGHRHTIPLLRNREDAKRDTAEWTEDALQLGVIFSEILQKLKSDNVEPGPWLSEIIGDLTRDNPAERARLDRALLLRACPDTADMQHRLNKAGWPVGHPEFQRLHGREWLREAFISFCQNQSKDGQGGLFLVSGEAGMGKTALLTEWCLLPTLPLGTREQAPAPLHPQRLCPAFFLQKNDPLRSQSEQLWANLSSQLDTAWPADKSPNSDEFRDLLQKAAQNLPEHQLLVVLIDGLDQAKDPDKIIDFLRRTCTKNGVCRLPDRVFLVVTTNPVDASGYSLTDKLNRMSGCVTFTLQADDDHGKRDMLKLWRSECRYCLPKDSVRSHAEQAEQAVQAAAGIPMILCCALREIAAGTLKLDEFLRRKVSATIKDWHDDRWKAVLQADGSDLPVLFQLAALLTVAREPVTLEQLAFWMDDNLPKVQLLLKRLSPMVSTTSTISDCQTVRRWMLCHESVRMFFSEYFHDVPELTGDAHSKIARKLLSVAQSHSWADHTDSYTLQHVVAHLLAKPEAVIDDNRKTALECASELLTDPAFLAARLNTATRP